MTQSKNVRPISRRLTDADARHLLSAGLIRVCHNSGPSRVAFEVGCDEKTIRRARDEDSTLGLAYAFNLLDVDKHALDELAAAKGYAFVPLAVAASVDAIVAQSASIHSIAEARSENSPGGPAELDCELIAMEATVDAASASLDHLKARILAAKLRRAA